MPTPLVAEQRYVPPSLTTTLLIVRSGVFNDPPLYFVEDPITIGCKPVLITLYHVTEVTLGLADMMHDNVTEFEGCTE